jgi:hypothetical protein
MKEEDKESYTPTCRKIQRDIERKVKKRDANRKGFNGKEKKDKKGDTDCEKL